MRNVSFMIVAVGVLFVCAPATACAEVLVKITVSAVSVNQTPASGYPIERLIDDSGMSGPNLEVQEAEGYTLAGPWRQMNFEGVANVIADSKITFDLGTVEDVSAMNVWNYSENADYGDYTKWGVKDFTLWSSIDGVDYTQVGSTHTLTQDDGVTNDSHGTISLTGVSARYLRMDLINIHAGIEIPVNYGLGEVRFYAMRILGDANGDGYVNEADAAALAGNWQMMSGASWAQGDFNKDGNVDDIDATILAANWTTAGTNAVPEPAVTALLIGGLACFLLRRRVAK